VNGIYLALDYGGTKHTVAGMEADRLPAGDSKITPEELPEWSFHRRVFSPPGADAAYDLRTTFELAAELLAGKKPAAVGVSFGGPVDFTTGTVRLSHHVPGWENIPLAQQLVEAFGAQALVDNDANVAALGEHRFGAGQGYDSLLYITVSTGVGGGWILNGSPWRGAEGMSGEIGHTVVDPHGPLCLCGKRGCVERLASGPYLAQDARDRMEEDRYLSPGLRALVGGRLEKLTAVHISKAARQGDPLGSELLERSAWALGTAIGSAANLVNPQLFVLGGGVTKSGRLWWERLRAAARETALPEVHFEIQAAALGDDAPLWGALALAQDCSAG
jgi:glucokinase